jgi:hypothetical protein
MAFQQMRKLAEPLLKDEYIFVHDEYQVCSC